MSISVADPTRLPTASLDADYRLAELNSRKLPGQTWISIGKRKLPTVVRAVGTPTGIIYASPGKQPPGLSVPATTAQLQATCYYGNAKGVYLQVPGEWWIYLDSATAETIVVYDDISEAAILQSLGIVVVGGSSGLAVDTAAAVGLSAATVPGTAIGMDVNARKFSFDRGTGDWRPDTSDIGNSGDGIAISTIRGQHVLSHVIGGDLTGGAPSLMRRVEARSLANLNGGADSLIGLLTGSALYARLANGAVVNALDCDGIATWQGLADTATRRLLNTLSLLAARDTNLGQLVQLGGRSNYSDLALMFGTNAVGVQGLAVNARQRWADLCEEGTAAEDSGLTITLPAPGANLRQHIVGIEISKFAAAALVAGATPILVTSTNLVATPAWTFPREAAAQGTATIRQVFPSHVIRASAANTAVTIVAPAITDVIWKITVFYYNA